MQHPNKHTCNIRLEKQLKHSEYQYTCTTIATYATSWSTFATSTWNTCNIQMKHLKHLKHTLATCVFSAQCHLAAWMNRGARRRRGGRRRCMELTGAPLGKDLLGGLGEHMCKARKHSGWAFARAPLGEHLLGTTILKTSWILFFLNAQGSLLDTLKKKVRRPREPALEREQAA
jgi:hypothetical protein